MELGNKNILIISPQPWNHIFVSKHHYAVYLSRRGNRVFFLNPPNKKLSLSETEYDNLWVLDYLPFVKGLRFLPSFLQKSIMKAKFTKLQRKSGVCIDIVWSFDDSVFYDLSVLPKKILKIFHNVDLNQNFQFEKAAGTADICFGVCSPVVKRLEKFNKNSHFINHGFNDCSDFTATNILSDINGIKAFYAGNLDSKYLDWDTLYYVIKSNKGIQFFFAGKWDDEIVKGKMLAQKNVQYLGILPASQLSGLYKASDVLLLCYKYCEEPEQLSNSHKLMEYLGAGKVIVASWTSEYWSQRDLILMSKEKSDYPLLFEKAINNLGFFNSPELVNKRIHFANENTYEKQLKRIESLVLNFYNNTGNKLNNHVH